MPFVALAVSWLDLTGRYGSREAAFMTNSHCGHRSSTEIISYCVWLYYTFPLSFHDIEKMMLYRDIKVTYEAIRLWCLEFV